MEMSSLLASMRAGCRTRMMKPYVRCWQRSVCPTWPCVPSFSECIESKWISMSGWTSKLKRLIWYGRKALTFAERNKTCVERIVQEIVGGIPSLRVFSVVMKHPDEVPDWVGESAWLPNHYRFLLQRMNGYAREADSQCVVAFDSQDEGNDQIIVNRMKNYFFRSAEGRLKHRIEVVQ